LSTFTEGRFLPWAGPEAYLNPIGQFGWRFFFGFGFKQDEVSFGLIETVAEVIAAEDFEVCCRRRTHAELGFGERRLSARDGILDGLPCFGGCAVFFLGWLSAFSAAFLAFGYVLFGLQYLVRCSLEVMERNRFKQFHSCF
jgi:hypothetical protein